MRQKKPRRPCLNGVTGQGEADREGGHNKMEFWVGYLIGNIGSTTSSSSNVSQEITPTMWLILAAVIAIFILMFVVASWAFLPGRCPRCGARPEIEDVPCGLSSNKQVTCPVCDLNSGPYFFESEAIKAWNDMCERWRREKKSK